MRPVVLIVLCVFTLGITVSACNRAPVGGPDRNADDVTFLQTMIGHHEQAVELATMVPAHTGNAALVALAQQINDRQRSDTNGFRAQLAQWGQPSQDPHATGTPGTVDQATMDRLKTLTGPAFDKLWLQSMITHHRGAITMAENEVAHGRNPDAIALAKSVVASEQNEVDQMEQLLGTAVID